MAKYWTNNMASGHTVIGAEVVTTTFCSILNCYKLKPFFARSKNTEAQSLF